MSTRIAFRSFGEISVTFNFVTRVKVAIAFTLAPLLAACIVCGSTRLARANPFNDTTHKKLKSVELGLPENTCLLAKSSSKVLLLDSLKTTRDPASKLFGAARSTVDMLSHLSLAIAAYRFRPATLMATALEKAKLAIGKVIIGTASMYNPYRPDDKTAGGTETASGERYNAKKWTAAIQTDLRDKFGGVRYGNNYQPAYALVEDIDKRVIVKINDVGPLKPGRIIDLNERTMRYFDPSLELGLIRNVNVTPLPGDDWMPGPIEGEHLVRFVSKLEKRLSLNDAQLLAAN